MKMKRSDTTVAINAIRNKKLDDAVIKVIIETKQQTKKSELVHHLIDNYLNDAVEDLIVEKSQK